MKMIVVKLFVLELRERITPKIQQKNHKTKGGREILRLYGRLTTVNEMFVRVWLMSSCFLSSVKVIQTEPSISPT